MLKVIDGKEYDVEQVSYYDTNTCELIDVDTINDAIMLMKQKYPNGNFSIMTGYYTIRNFKLKRG